MRQLLRASVVAALLIPALAFAGDKSKKKKTVPAIFGTATYVYVEAEAGDVYDPRLLPEDRQAIFDVEEGLRKWKRYVLTATPGEAELIFYVRKGRVASVNLGATVGAPVGPGMGPGPGGGPGQGPGQGQGRPGLGGPGVTGGGEVGPPDDLLEVRMCNAGGGMSAPIWMHSQPDGLSAPHVPLLAALRAAVEKDYPQ